MPGITLPIFVEHGAGHTLALRQPEHGLVSSKTSDGNEIHLMPFLHFENHAVSVVGVYFHDCLKLQSR